MNAGGIFRLYITFDEHYNIRPPEVCFHTIPFHPNGNFNAPATFVFERFSSNGKPKSSYQALLLDTNVDLWCSSVWTMSQFVQNLSVDMITGKPCVNFLDDLTQWKANYSVAGILLTIQVTLNRTYKRSFLTSRDYPASFQRHSLRFYLKSLPLCQSSPFPRHAGYACEPSHWERSEPGGCSDDASFSAHLQAVGVWLRHDKQAHWRRVLKFFHLTWRPFFPPCAETTHNWQSSARLSTGALSQDLHGQTVTFSPRRKPVKLSRDTALPRSSHTKPAKISFEDYHVTWSGIATSKSERPPKNLCERQYCLPNKNTCRFRNPPRLRCAIAL